MLVKCLGVPVNSAPAPDVVLVDASQLLYHVVWPVAGKNRIEGLPSDAQHTTPMQISNPGEFKEQKSPRQHPVWISPTE